VGDAELFRRISLLLALVFLVSGCATQSSRLPSYATRAGLLARDTCFGIENLPEGFEVVARQILDNRLIAQRDTPSVQPDDLVAWQRLSGAQLHYAYEPPSMPGEDADGFLTQDELERALARAHAERQAAPFIAAFCRLDIFASATGAAAAFQTLSQATPGRALPHRQRGATSQLTLALAPVPGFARSTLWFRVDNVVAAVSLTAACDASVPEECRVLLDRTEALAALLIRRIAARVPGISVPETREGASDLRDQAEQLCPERDYSTCVSDFLTHVATGYPVMLCVSPIGQWTLIPLAAPDRPVPCPDDWTVAGLLPRERSNGSQFPRSATATTSDSRRPRRRTRGRSRRTTRARPSRARPLIPITRSTAISSP
jgi:hypothetical protein